MLLLFYSSCLNTFNNKLTRCNIVATKSTLTLWSDGGTLNPPIPPPQVSGSQTVPYTEPGDLLSCSTKHQSEAARSSAPHPEKWKCPAKWNGAKLRTHIAYSGLTLSPGPLLFFLLTLCVSTVCAREEPLSPDQSWVGVLGWMPPSPSWSDTSIFRWLDSAGLLLCFSIGNDQLLIPF